jgi:glycosyltransferase involved in cell wall biosynthesis
MKILITNIWLADHGGTEVGVRDLATALHKNGIDVEVYSPKLGAVADEIVQAGIHVVNSIRNLHSKPDLIQGQHFGPTMDAMIEFPDVPVIYILHDRTFPTDVPPKLNQIVRYIAVDYNCLDRLVTDNNIPVQNTSVLYNWVDTDRFKLRSNIRKKPQTALVFSNYARKDNYYLPIREACDQLNIKLDVIGCSFNNEIRDPENVLHNYDLVFAKAKAAMESLATGAGVILCDTRGLGEFVTAEKFQYFRKFNFGMKTLTRPVEVSSLKVEIARYNTDEIYKTSRMIREAASFPTYIREIVQIYKSAIEEYHHRDQLTNKAEDLQCLLGYFLQKQSDFVAVKLQEQQMDLNAKADEIQGQMLKKHDELQHVFSLVIKSRSFKFGRFLTWPFRKIKKVLRKS